ncbi:type II toxin-antitoxin system RelE family toxin [Streptomyces odonnellii]|uniref:type II toxin-antitoxin system RelE family toxin n=1 Tax=Streptomyces odonnellii TaxID=1417980 RepID=UPI0006259093|nr:type II toxin-antitoxin system RelE/ParE family toxin [Streptomyces odonnellii]
MSYEVVWEAIALDAATRFMKSDPEGLQQVFATTDLLAENPRPDGTVAYGSPDLRRMRVGRYRLVYQIHQAQIRVAVMHLGRTS